MPQRTATSLNAPTNDDKEIGPEVTKLCHDLDAINSKVHGATNSTPETPKILAEMQKIGDSKTVTSISSMAETHLHLAVPFKIVTT
ncbi:unnamed protein product [Microthlaspi erraticum]|uniref:Uncharacterized protein n=1 Tax=Microthlaspi erraticum TaxID=1685480 RepID=A0A6D2JKX9_9BRAS|nr:unnamed protein product [Microthlaspi erraticum]